MKFKDHEHLNIILKTMVCQKIAGLSSVAAVKKKKNRNGRQTS